MRYEKAENLLRLCVMMAGRNQGVSIEMIQEEFSVSRRTAERMRDAALRLLPWTDERTDDAGFKYWRTKDLPKGLIATSAEDLNALQAAIHVMEINNRPDTAGCLRDLSDKLLAQQSRARQYQIEPDLELLMQSEGLALRPGPKVALSIDFIEMIRTAILSSRKVRVAYIKRHKSAPKEVILEPYGFLYGQRPYLIAKQDGKPALRHYRLQGLKTVQLINTTFQRDESFNLEGYSKRLFGVFNEPPFQVLWRFDSEVAADAAEYIFHPDQQLEYAEDGGLLVRFKAAGAREMAWHLMTWGDKVTVIEPADFWTRSGIKL